MCPPVLGVRPHPAEGLLAQPVHACVVWVWSALVAVPTRLRCWMERGARMWVQTPKLGNLIEHDSSLVEIAGKWALWNVVLRSVMMAHSVKIAHPPESLG